MSKNKSINTITNYLLISLFLIFFIGCTHTENWPGFRGPDGQGITSDANLPTVWNDSTNILWRTGIPGTGWSSPVVWEDQLYVTTVTDSGRICKVLALDLESGKIIWNKKVLEIVPGHMHRTNSHASSTPVIDGKNIYSVFSDGSVVALDLDGEMVWENREIEYFSEHGLGVSPILYEDVIIIPFDGSGRPPDIHSGWTIPWDKSVIVAYNKHNGEIKWKASRGLSRIAHVTPVIMNVEGEQQLISSAGDVIQGFNPENGKLLWTVENLGEGVVPSVVKGDGVVFTTSGWGDPTIRATRPTLADSATIVWEQKKNVSRIPSFIYKKPYLFSITEKGWAMCLNENTGQIIWEKRLDGKYWASPILSGNLIYLLNIRGSTTIIEAGPEYKEIAVNNISGKYQASMAIGKGRILIRSEKYIYCIGDSKSE